MKLKSAESDWPMWVFLWILVSGFILGVFAWSMSILFQQKKAWSGFAKKKKLKYEGGGLNGSPSITGTLEGYKVSYYTEAQMTSDVRGQRYVTVVEFQLGPGMATGAAIASKEYGPFISTINFDTTISPDYPDWNEDYIIRTRDADLAKKYLTAERAKVLSALFSMKNTIGLFFYDELEAVLRIETVDPLRSEDLMEKLTRRLVAACRILAPSETEKSENEANRKSAEEREEIRLAVEEAKKKEEAERSAHVAPLKPLDEGSPK